MDKIKIIVVDRDESWLKTSIMFLGNEPDFFIVGVASSEAAAFELVKTQDADIVIIDIDPDKQNGKGISVIKKINQIKAINVIVVTAEHNEPLMVQSLDAGAIHYCPKEKFKDITYMIHQAYYHNVPVPILLKEYYKFQKELAFQTLTPAENEVFELLLNDCSLSQMEYQLNKAEGTIKHHINSVFKKLNVKNRQQVIEKFSFYSRFSYHLSN